MPAQAIQAIQAAQAESGILTEREKMGHPIDFGRKRGGDIPDNSVAAGNPCRVIGSITEEDRKTCYDRDFEHGEDKKT